MRLGFLRVYFGTVRIWDWEMSDVKVLFYLHTHRMEERPSSPEKLARELGISEQTVTGAYARLRRRGCIAPPPTVGNVRDPREFAVTVKGKKALRPLLNVVGYGDALILSSFALAMGVIAGGFYPISQLYPAYSLAALLVVAIFAAVFLGYSVQVARASRRNRREQISDILRKPDEPAEIEPRDAP